ncbi:MAG: hypothetical protein LBS60_14415 [Deltaproteobacteria bacterium]|jgi:hypothetical protein|nr:hypothetical protein [Deltaproteobacteria bacterium]
MSFVDAEKTLFKPAPQTPPCDYFPAPANPPELIFTGGLKLPFPNRHVYAFNLLGGPASYGNRGTLTWGKKTLEARLISPLKAKTLFLTFEPFPPNDQGGRAIWRPNDDPPLPPSDSPGVLGSKEFLDPNGGWLAAVNDFEPPKEEDPPFSGPALGWELAPLTPPLGVSFIWEEPLNDILSDLIQALPSNETIWVLADEEEYLSAAAVALKRTGRRVISQGPSLLPTLAELELSQLIDQKAKDLDLKVASLREKIALNRTKENELKEYLKTARFLMTQEKDLARLKREMDSREVMWSFSAGELDLAHQRWAKQRPEKSFWSFLKKKSGQDQNLAQSQLAAAEEEMARTRREKKALMDEAKTLRERIETAKAILSRRPAVSVMEEELKTLEEDTRRLAKEAADLASSFSRTGAVRAIFAEKPASVVFPGFSEPESLTFGGVIDNLIVVNPKGDSLKAQKALAALADWPSKRLLVLGDYATWPWVGGPLDLKTRPFSSFVGPLLYKKSTAPQVLSGPFPLGVYLEPPEPAKVPWLKDLNLTQPLNHFSWPGPWGPVWRALDELGPFNPTSALASVELALAAQRLAKDLGLIYILTPSPAQAALVRELLLDLNPQVTGIVAGEPADLASFPPADLVIGDTALGQEHPWAWPTHGRGALLTALKLAKGALILVGDAAAIQTLAPSSPLRLLWEAAATARPAFRWPPLTTVPMWEALNRAQKEAFFCLPAFDPSWWGLLSLHFQAALNRKVKISILAELPPPNERKYSDSVIRDLKLFGARVVVAEGFTDLMGLIDQSHFVWGTPGRLVNGRMDWNWHWTVEIPKAAPTLAKAIQAPLIAEKLGPRGFRHCPLCGWPYVLINQAKAEDFDHRQPLRLGCLNPSCPNRHKPRRLDERWPFLTPPVCQVDQETPYIRVPKGKSEIWACPNPDHPCPRLKVIPGDVNPNKGKTL